MKKNKITLGLYICTLAMSSTFFTSCIDDQVSEEVSSIRQAQTAKILAEANETNANVAAIESATALQNLENEITTIRNNAEQLRLVSEQEAAQSDLDLKKIQDQLALANTQNQIDLLAVQAQIDKANSDNNLKLELEKIETDLRQKGLDDIADAYEAYTDALIESQGKQSEKAGVEIDITLKEMQIAQAGIDLDFALEQAQIAVDEKTADIAMMTASLEVLQAVDSDFSLLNAEIETAKAEKATLDEATVQLAIDLDKAERSFLEANLEQTNANELRGRITQFEARVEGHEDAIESLNEELVNTQEEVSETIVEFEEQKAEIALEIEELEAELVGREALLIQRLDEETVVIEAQEAFDPSTLDAQVDETLQLFRTADLQYRTALANLRAYQDSTPIDDQQASIIEDLEDERDRTLDIRQDSIDDFRNATDAQTNISSGQAAYFSTISAAASNVRIAQGNITSIETSIETLNQDILDIDESIVEENEKITDIEADIATEQILILEDQASLAAAGTAPTDDELDELRNEVTGAIDALNSIRNTNDANDASINIIENLINSLQREADAIENGDIADLEEAIKDLEDELKELQEDLDDAIAQDDNATGALTTLNADLTDLENELEVLNRDIANLTIEITEKKDIYDTLVAELP